MKLVKISAIMFLLAVAACTANVDDPTVNQGGQTNNGEECVKNCEATQSSCTGKCNDEGCKVTCKTSYDKCSVDCTKDGG